MKIKKIQPQLDHHFSCLFTHNQPPGLYCFTKKLAFEMGIVKLCFFNYGKTAINLTEK